MNICGIVCQKKRHLKEKIPTRILTSMKSNPSGEKEMDWTPIKWILRSAEEE
jgi:hypothetical protein